MRSVLLLSALGCVALAGEARACSVPVFRYALERWKPSPYPLYVFHRDPLTDAEKAAVAKLEDASLNARVQIVDLAGEVEPGVLKLWRAQGKGTALPFVLAAYPDAGERTPPAWTGSLDGKALARLLDSPARRQVAKLLTRGESAVWVLLLSGDRTADDAAAALLDRELARLRDEIELPEQPEEGSMLLTALPLRVSFAVVRLDRTKAEEADLARLLLGTEDGLGKAKGPIVFPIFGRGRVLTSYEGDSLTAKEIARGARFLCGACSCQVKDLNPGTDLLMTADWDGLLDPTADPTPREAEPPVAPAIPPGMSGGPDSGGKKIEPTSRPAAGWWLAGGVGAVALVTLISGGRALRGRRRAPGS
jgi:hypothetical protein